MAGEAILLYTSDLMFSVRVREVALNRDCTVSVVENDHDFKLRLEEVHPKLVILDLNVAGANIESHVENCKAVESRVVVYVPHAKRDLRARAQTAGVDAIYSSSQFKSDLVTILPSLLSE